MAVPNILAQGARALHAQLQAELADVVAAKLSDELRRSIRAELQASSQSNTKLCADGLESEPAYMPRRSEVDQRTKFKGFINRTAAQIMTTGELEIADRGTVRQSTITSAAVLSGDLAPHDEWHIEQWTTNNETDLLLAPPPVPPKPQHRKYVWQASPRSVGMDYSSGYREVPNSKGDFNTPHYVSQSPLAEFLSSTTLDAICCVCVLLNCLLIGVETEFAASSPDVAKPIQFEVADLLFCAVFTVELVLRICQQGATFCYAQGWAWNLFDFLVVTLQLFEIALKRVLMMHTSNMNMSFLRVLRLLRLIRITRIIKVLRVIEELRTIVTSIACSMKSLGWIVLLLFLMIYTLSICVTQIVLEHRNFKDVDDDDQLYVLYGSLFRTVITLYESITAGMEWKHAVNPLLSISPWLGLCFCLYIAFSIFAVMNVVTGVFVERAIQGSQVDKQEYMARHLCSVAFKEVGEVGGEIDLEGFRKLMETEEMKMFFKEIEVVMPDAESFFFLLDEDGSGTVDVVEFLSNCMRLRGPAKALELSLHVRETARMYDWLERHIFTMEARLAWICKVLDPSGVSTLAEPPPRDQFPKPPKILSTRARQQ